MPIGVKIVYAQSYIHELRFEFLKKFDGMPGSKTSKLLKVDMARSTYQVLLTTHEFRKKTIEAMRAYVEEREPKYYEVMSNEVWCSGCEEIIPPLEQSSLYHCLMCVPKDAPKVTLTHYIKS